MLFFIKWLSINVKPQCLHDSVPKFFPYILYNLKCSQCGEHWKNKNKTKTNKTCLNMSENILGQESAFTLSRYLISG